MAKKKLKQYKRLTNPLYKIPTSVTDVIPINRIAENGIFELEAGNGVKLYDRVYLFEDINFSLKDEDEKEETQNRFKQLLNSLNVSYKIIISNEPQNVEQLNKSIYKSAKNPENEPLAEAYNEVIANKVKESKNAIKQVRYFVISTLKYDFEGAEAFFDSIESQLSQSFKKLGSGLLPLDATQRLRALHNFFRMGEEREFAFDWEDSLKHARDWRRDIINTSIREHHDYLTMDYGKRYVSVLFIRSYPSGLNDPFVKDVTSLPFPITMTMDCEPVDSDYAIKELNKKYMKVQLSIDKQQEQKNKNGAFSTEVSYDKRREVEELEEYMDGLRSFDEQQFYVDILFTVTAFSKEELEKQIEQLMSVGSSYNVDIVEHIDQQLNGLMTTLPTASRYVNTMRPLFTTSLSAFIPFNVQEINDKEGFFYGINQVSKNNIIANRKLLKNGNGYIFGVPGSGKSQDAKFEIGQVVAYTEDDIIIIDPMGEYKEMVENWGGDYIVFTQDSNNKNYMNPLHVPNDGVPDENMFISEKAEFLYALCEQAIKPDILTNRHINVIDRCTKEIYEEYFEKSQTNSIDSPTILTLREKFIEYGEQGDKYAKEMADQLESFTTGTLNIFAHQETINSNNRLMAYDLSSLGKKMKAMAMLVSIENIKSRLRKNKAKKVATWVYLDEIHELWKDEYSVIALETLWREVRKLGGLCTGITQNILDGLANDSTKSMISNSEFTMLLEQGKIDKENLFDVFEISDAQLDLVNGVPSGTGLVRFGERLIPFDNVMPKNSKLYDLYNTSFHENVGEDA